MAEGLNLTLPERGRDHHGPPKMVLALLAALLAVGLANIVVSLRDGRQESAPPRRGLPPEAQKDLALKLEKQGLRGEAAAAWEEYLAASNADAQEQAKVWYRIGGLHQDDARYDKALQAYYRSESFAKVDEIAPEIARRTQACLESMGKVAALRYHLADRVGMKKDEKATGEEIVAEIGPEKITRAQLDATIERQIDRQIEMFAAYMSPDQRRKQKESLMSRLSAAAERERMLQEFLAEECLHRKAREEKLAESLEVRERLKELERKALAQEVLSKELESQIKITQGDVQTYYEAHKKEYVVPERARIAHVLAKDQKQAEEVLRRLKVGEKLADLAKQLSGDEATKDKGGEIAGWMEKGASGPGIPKEAAEAIFSMEAGKIVEKAFKGEKGFHVIEVLAREPERTRPFEEAGNEAYQALRMQKEKEVRQQLFDELRRRYNVVIHASKFAEQKPERPAERK